MARIDIQLTDTMATWVEERARSGAYRDAGEYVRELIRRDQERVTVHHELQELLTEGIESGISDRTPEQLLEAARAAAVAARAKSDLWDHQPRRQ
jgi:antitoxin ParD1/3/4